jgi:hypothetical protein
LEQQQQWQGQQSSRLLRASGLLRRVQRLLHISMVRCLALLQRHELLCTSALLFFRQQ